MSTRAMGRMYASMTGGGGMSTTPGRVSLIDILTGNTPLNLQKKQQEFEAGETTKGYSHEKELQELVGKQQKELEETKARIAEEKASSDQVRSYLVSRNMADTPENRKRIGQQMADLDLQNAIQRAQNELAANQSDEVKKATIRGRAAQELQPTVPLTKASQLNAQMGGAATGTDYANPDRSLSTTPDFLKGSTPFQNVNLAPTFINPTTGQPMGFQPVTSQGNNPATFTPGGGIPFSGGALKGGFPVDPSIRASILNNTSQQGMTPPDDGSGNAMAPIPADKQPSNGGGVATPRLQTTPQLLQQPDPSTFSPIKGPLNALIDWLMQGNQDSPFYTTNRFQIK